MNRTTYNIFNAIETQNETKALELLKTQSKFKNKNNETVLMHACKYNMHNLIDQILLNNHDINSREDKGRNALYYACHTEDTTSIPKLISAGIDVDNIDTNLQTALVYSIVYGHKNSTDILLNYDMQLDYSDHSQRSALIWACFLNDEPNALKLLEKNIQLDKKDETSNTALIYCIKNKNLNLIKKLKQKGAKFEFSSPGYFNILHYAADFSCPEIINFLLPTQNINEADKNNKTALIGACRHKKADNAKILLENGAIFDTITEDGKKTLLFLVENCLNTLLIISSLEELTEYKKNLMQNPTLYQFHIEQIDKTILNHDLSNQLLEERKIIKTLKI